MFLWIHIPIVIYFQGNLQAEIADSSLDKDRKSRALCFPGSWFPWRRGWLWIIPVIRKKLWVKWRQAVFFSALLFWVYDSYGYVTVTDLVACLHLWQEGKRQRQALSLPRWMSSMTSATHYCSKHLLVVLPSHKTECIKTKSCRTALHFYLCWWETLSQDCILQLKFCVTAVSGNNSENITLPKIHWKEVLEFCFFSSKC